MGKVEKGITGLVEGLDSVIRTSLACLLDTQSPSPFKC